MLTFLRKIRRSLIESSSFRKYVLYAAGEIALVVIGILIALQINNWNEDRKTRQYESILLKELQVELKSNKDDIDQTVNTLNTAITANKVIVSLYENPPPYSDTMDVHFARLYSFSFFIANKTVYEKLKITGIDIIQNEEIRKRVSALYTFHFSRLEEIEALYMHEHYVNYIKPIYMNEFTTFDWPNSVKIKDYDAFIRNESIIQALNFSIVNLGIVMGTHRNLSGEIDEVLGLIDQELQGS